MGSVLRPLGYKGVVYGTWRRTWKLLFRIRIQGNTASRVIGYIAFRF